VRASDTISFSELDALERLLERRPEGVRVHTAGHVEDPKRSWPLYAIELGDFSAGKPAMGFFGGVHGIERIGTQVLLAFLHTLFERLRWDDWLHRELEDVGVVAMPLINPSGMYRSTRSNHRNVDLMRNAPVDGEGHIPWPLGGQRLSPRLPWYRGSRSDPMETEAATVCQVVRSRLLDRPFSLSLDCHSGFGMDDRVWFPYAGHKRPMEHIAQAYALRNLFRETYPHHVQYLIEPQSRAYRAHGDLWDYLYREAVTARGGVFLPLTLEMGSWRWVRKNPTQIFKRLGLFNPMLPHREHRILRQHLTLLEFLLRATGGHRNWLPPESREEALRSEAVSYWFRDR